MKNNVYPSKEEIVEALTANPNLKVLSQEGNQVVFEDLAVNFLENKNEKFVANFDVDLDELIMGEDAQITFMLEEFVSTLPEILFLPVDKIILDSDFLGEENYLIQNGVIRLNANVIEESVDFANNDENIVDLDTKFQEELKRTITKSLFDNLLKNPLFFGEGDLNEVDVEKYLI